MAIEFHAQPECPKCGGKTAFTGTGTGIHPDATNRDYLRGLLLGSPPSVHISFYCCENDHNFQIPSRDELAEMWRTHTIEDF